MRTSAPSSLQTISAPSSPASIATASTPVRSCAPACAAASASASVSAPIPPTGTSHSPLQRPITW